MTSKQHYTSISFSCCVSETKHVEASSNDNSILLYPFPWLPFLDDLFRVTDARISAELGSMRITPVFSKVFERLLAKRLKTYAEKNNLFPNLQLGFHKGLGACDFCTR